MSADQPEAEGIDAGSELSHGRRLQILTIAWNVGEVLVTVTLGLMSGSLALVAFGLDSLIEVFTSTVVLWHMEPNEEAHSHRRDRRAERLVAVAFALLSASLMVASTRALVVSTEPDSSSLGIVYLAATAAVMLGLAHLKRRTGMRLGNPVFLSEAKMTQIDAYLAMGILLALVLNGLWGWWWADPLAAGGIAIVAASEAFSGFRGRD